MSVEKSNNANYDLNTSTYSGLEPIEVSGVLRQNFMAMVSSSWLDIQSYIMTVEKVILMDSGKSF